MVAQPITAAQWLTRWRYYHALVMTAVTLGIIALCLLHNDLPLTAQVIALAVAVAVFGVPHGGLDHIVARTVLQPTWGRHWLRFFLLGYLGLAATVWVAWRLAPVVVMGLFFLASAIHFGLGDIEPDLTTPKGYGIEVLARGAIPIVIVAWCFPHEVATFLHWIAPAMQASSWLALVQTARYPTLIVLVPALGWVVAYHTMMAMRQHDVRHATHAAELVALVVLCAVAPPLMSFLIYFCGWHAARHTLWLASHLEPHRGIRGLYRVMTRAMPLTCITLLGSAVAWWQLEALAGSLEAAVHVVFVMLSMLTFPHMVVTTLAESNAMASAARLPHHNDA